MKIFTMGSRSVERLLEERSDVNLVETPEEAEYYVIVLSHDSPKDLLMELSFVFPEEVRQHPEKSALCSFNVPRTVMERVQNLQACLTDEGGQVCEDLVELKNILDYWKMIEDDEEEDF